MALSPWLRWVGGKRSLAPLLVDEVMRTRPALYIEPFLGGGAVTLSMPSAVTKILGDANPVLIDCWLCVQRYPVALSRELRTVERRYGDTKEGYLAAREAFNRMVLSHRSMWLARSAHMMYLNARCFNGLWRTNAQGLFNVPYGDVKTPRAINADELSAASAALKYVTIRADRFERVCGIEVTRRINAVRGNPTRTRTVMRGVAVYADPPYHGTFNGYAKGGFTDEDQALLASTLQAWASMGAAIWASNADTPLIRQLYRWAQVESTDEQHNVGSKADRRGKRGCVLIRGGAACST